MNADSKLLKRFIVLLNKAPFIAFFESPDYISISPHLRSLGVVDGDGSIVGILLAQENSDLRRIIAETNKLPDPIAHSIIEALANALPNNAIYFPVHFFTKSDWQNYIEWQNVDDKPIVEHQFTITVDEFTHDLHIVYSNDLEAGQRFDGIIQLSSLNIDTPFPQTLLKECVVEVHDIIINMTVNRQQIDLSRSNYLSVLQTGHSTFNWVNLKKIEKDLLAVLKEAGITIEE